MNQAFHIETLSTNEKSTINKVKNNSKIKEDKDEVISLLKERVIELEQNANNLIMMNIKYKNLQASNESLMEEKLQLQYDIKNTKEVLNKQILNLRSENEHLQLVLNDKIIIIKKIIEENTDLNQEVEIKSIDLHGAIQQIDSLRCSYDQCIREKTDLEKIIQDLTDLSNNQKADYEKISNNHNSLNKLFHEQEKEIQFFKENNEKLNDQFNCLNVEYHNLIEKLCQRDESLTQLQGKFSENQRIINQLESELKECAFHNDFLKKDLIIIKTNSANDQQIKNEQEKEINSLHHALYDLEDKSNRLKDELRKEQLIKEKFFEEKETLHKEIKNLENNMRIINKQNEHLVKVIEDMKTLDDKVQNELKKRERIELILQENKEIIQQSIEHNHIVLTSSNQNTISSTQFNYHRDYSSNNTYNKTYDLMAGSNLFDKSLFIKP